MKLLLIFVKYIINIINKPYDYSIQIHFDKVTKEMKGSTQDKDFLNKFLFEAEE